MGTSLNIDRLSNYEDLDDFCAIIESKEGSAVSQQCKDIFEGEDLDEQNPTALYLIARIAKSKKETELYQQITDYLESINYDREP